MTTASGSLPLYLDKRAFQKLFPTLAAFFPALQSAEILATTRLVGMECPGLHSLYSGLDLNFHDPAGPADISYQVTRSEARFSCLWLAVKGPSMKGTITAFARPRPSTQAGMDAVSRIVQRGEFAPQRALVIGGSRGLGEIAAKIIAAGGGEVRLTYHRGKADAERVAGEIRAAGARGECLAFDATDSATSLVPGLGVHWTPTHLYYFATPLISLDRSLKFSPELFHNYCRFYVDGFSHALAAALELGGERLSVLYPSTIFLDSFYEHTAEYCAAKAAGEHLCGHLEKTFSKIRVHCPRLPRMKTDQTAGLMPRESADPLEVLLEEIRRMQ